MVLSEEPEISTGDSPLTVPGLSSKHVTGREWSFRVMSFLPVFESQITMHESSEADANLFAVMNHNLTNCKQAKRHGNQWATGTQHAGEHGMRGQSVLLFLEKTKRKKNGPVVVDSDHDSDDVCVPWQQLDFIQLTQTFAISIKLNGLRYLWNQPKIKEKWKRNEKKKKKKEKQSVLNSRRFL